MARDQSSTIAGPVPPPSRRRGRSLLTEWSRPRVGGSAGLGADPFGERALGTTSSSTSAPRRPGSGAASRRCRRAWRPRASAPRRGRTRRAEAAAERPLHTTDPISRIGRDVGWPDQDYFAGASRPVSGWAPPSTTSGSPRACARSRASARV